ANNVEQIKRLKIHTGDEIENLYHALLKTTQNAKDYFERLRRAKRQVAEMEELAHKDSLTGIKNKAAYDEATALLDEKISAGVAKFCIAMVDVNYLKKVNDTYGHEKGNAYLLNASKLICSVFGEEHVYRIGGDEFVVVLEGDKVSLSKYFVKQFNAEMARKNANKSLEPWEKVSAAVGLAFYTTNDKTADEVFKRADKEMYANKLAMKAARTD
ncbi:MAG: GGDEF domain-containing protein, partial [Selenomonadaceae bacterium]|nr:GGDEF domain-containing protein [Selenomonadaceae bacterium]